MLNIIATPSCHPPSFAQSGFRFPSSLQELFKPSSPAATPTSIDKDMTMALPQESNDEKRLYKTELCRSFAERNYCRYGNQCKFAHGEEELRSRMRHPKYKSELCRNYWTTRTCRYGDRCNFVHEITGSPQIMPSPSSPSPAMSPFSSPLPVVPQSVTGLNLGVFPSRRDTPRRHSDPQEPMFHLPATMWNTQLPSPVYVTSPAGLSPSDDSQRHQQAILASMLNPHPTAHRRASFTLPRSVGNTPMTPTMTMTNPSGLLYSITEKAVDTDSDLAESLRQPYATVPEWFPSLAHQDNGMREALDATNLAKSSGLESETSPSVVDLVETDIWTPRRQ
ncbi:hypothetical protein IWQ62_002563 [Dispira parvispora]|uniref:C3H1-type domain-containing protein n=1 Tax=Dispira parvispora TaxID=1520584 RepID=A0A9W8AVG5_9FUNG|nr:hypothetical protein IWQ62_002563 [Dispira parvispora]